MKSMSITTIDIRSVRNINNCIQPHNINRISIDPMNALRFPYGYHQVSRVCL